MNKLLAILGINLFFLQSASAIDAGSEGFFIANRASIKCGVTTKHKADLALMFLGYDTNSIKHFESTLKSKIESTLQEPGYCEDFKNTFDNYDPTKDPMMAKFNNKGNNQAVNSTQKTQNYDDCNDARDYEGCVKVKSGQTSASNSAETCKSGWCKSKGGIDKFGMSKPIGFWYKEIGPTIYYRDIENIKRVPHNGNSSRYLAMNGLYTYYQDPISATPGTYTNIGSARTSCTGSTYSSNLTTSINCTSTPAPQIYTPGRSATSGGGRSKIVDEVYDCKDKTKGIYFNGKLEGKWHKSNSLAFLCKRASQLPIRRMKL